MTDNEILTLTEVAQYLKVAEKTIHRLIKNKKIPCVRVGNQWRFMKTMIDDWLVSQMEVIPKNDLTFLMEKGEAEITFSRLLAGVVYFVTGQTKEDILKNLISPLCSAGYIKNPDHYLSKLMAREKMASTAMGDQIAIPHIRNPRENESTAPQIVIGISKEGIPFDAVDDKPVRLFMLVHTNSEILHLKILSKISVLFRDTENREKLINAATGDQLESALLQIEQMHKV